jgi:uncharacterized membrane protein
VVPTWTEPVATGASTLVGGPLGRHAVVGRSRFWTPLRVVLLAAILTLAAGWLVKAPCLQQAPSGAGGLALDWQDGRQYVAMCYTDIVTLYGDHRLAGGDLPYRSRWSEGAGDAAGAAPTAHYMDYPVVTGFFLWEVARLTIHYEALTRSAPWLPTGLPEVVFFDITAALLAAGWLVVVWAVRRARPVRPWDASLVALSPLALLHVFTGLDTLALAGVAGGLYALSRGRSAVCGLLFGLAAAAKLYAAVLLVPVILVGWRRGSPAGRRVLLTAVAAWLVVNLPVLVLYTPGWAEFFRVGIASGAEPDSWYFALSELTGWAGFDGPPTAGQTPWVLNMVVLGLLLAAAAGLAVLAWRAPRPPRLASLCFLMVAALLLVDKAWSPQSSLWLVPLAVLALPRWRLLLTWMTVDALVWVPRMFYYLGVENKGLPAQFFLAFVLVRDLLIILIMVLVVRSVLRPDTDPLRALGGDDPDWPVTHTRRPQDPPAESSPAGDARLGAEPAPQGAAQ